MLVRLVPILLLGAGAGRPGLLGGALGGEADARSSLVVSKIIVDRVEGGAPRLGGGGVQAVVGMRCAGGLDRTSLIAPAGRDFDVGMLAGLTARGVDVGGVTILDDVASTPGELIRYDADEAMTYEAVGWESWPALCAWEPPLPRAAECSVIHVLVEGGSGGGEVPAVARALAAAQGDRPLLSVEPILQPGWDPAPEALEGLISLTAVSDLVSPDWAAASVLAARDGGAAGGVDGDGDGGDDGDPRVVVSETQEQTGDVDKTKGARDVAQQERGAAQVWRVAKGCARALSLPSRCVLAVRDGARGSYVLANGELTWVPAVEVAVLDPTGAGNAYAGALAARIAAGDTAVSAGCVASAVGAAYCACPDWAPADLDEARAWVRARACELRPRLIPPVPRAPT